MSQINSNTESDKYRLWSIFPQHELVVPDEGLAKRDLNAAGIFPPSRTSNPHEQ
jgi:hypothetical protein